jgi:phosphate/sulfate permease
LTARFNACLSRFLGEGAISPLHKDASIGQCATLIHSMSTACKLLVLTALQVVVALVFLKGFLLTRVELPDVAQCQGSSCSSKPPTYQKAVVLIVDAVRYDFLCGKQSKAGQLSGSLMPKTLRWVQTGVRACLLLQLLMVVHCPTTFNPPADWTAGSSAAATSSKLSSLHQHVVWCHCVVQAGAAVASRFVADTPTITMSRLKALLTVRNQVCLLEQRL